MTEPIDKAAKVLAACMDYPWEPMPEQGRALMRQHAKAVVDAALSASPAPAEPVQQGTKGAVGHVARDSSQAHMHVNLPEGTPLYTLPHPVQPEEAVARDADISAYSILTSEKRHADEIRIERARQIEGPALWAVRLSGNCLNEFGKWEWEPMSSSRHDEFLARCRFKSAPEAIAAARAALSRDAGGAKG